MRKFRLLDYAAMIFAEVLPKKQPNLHHMKDEDYISLLSWCEDWEPEQVYKTAYKQSHLNYLQTWEEWSDDMKPLPGPVVAELQRALLIHHGVGTMRALMTYAFFHGWAQRLMKYSFWFFIGIILLYWFA